MKKTITQISAAIVLMATFAFTTHVSTTIGVDIEASTIAWKGSKIIGDSHNGNINLKEASLVIEDEKLKGGNFTIDMNSMTCNDLSGGMAKKLIGHLMSDDFFSVETYPEAKFVIKSFADKGSGAYNITGDLTIKGKTESISFPATFETKEGKSTAKASITFDRSKFDVKYGSDTFFDNLGDKAISNDITLDVVLVTK